MKVKGEHLLSAIIPSVKLDSKAWIYELQSKLVPIRRFRKDSLVSPAQTIAPDIMFGYF